MRADPGRNRRPHGRGFRRSDRACRHNRGLHGARRRQHDRATVTGCACGRGDRQRGSGRGRALGQRRATHGGDPWPGGADRSDRPPPGRSRHWRQLVATGCRQQLGTNRQRFCRALFRTRQCPRRPQGRANRAQLNLRTGASHTATESSSSRADELACTLHPGTEKPPLRRRSAARAEAVGGARRGRSDWVLS